MRSSRSALINWFFAFALTNTILISLINSYNLISLGDIESVHELIGSSIYFPVWLFKFTGAIGNATLLSLTLIFLCGIVPAFIISRIRPIRYFATISMSLLVIYLLADSYSYHIFRYHLSGIILQIVLHSDINQMLGLAGNEWLTILGLISAIITIEAFIGHSLWKLQIARKQLTPLLLFCIGCIVLSYLLWLSANFHNTRDKRYLLRNQVIIATARALPSFTAITRFLPTTSRVDRDLALKGVHLFYQPSKEQKPLHYPLHPLQLGKHGKKYNIVIIGADAWRGDMLNSKVTPNAFAFAKNNLTFRQHLSGGNCTKPGLFSLFYSLPSSYWNAMLSAKQGPVLLHALKQQQYKLGIFTSARNDMPPYHQTLFSEVNNLITHTPGALPSDRDQRIVSEFDNFIAKLKPNEHFFSFVFFNTSHSYCEAGHYPQPFQPARTTCNRIELGSPLAKSHPELYFNRYRNALHFVDRLIGKTLKILADKNLLDNTIVILTGDHGEEFNDNHKNYWGHTSNFSNVQLNTPLVVHWPGKKPQDINYMTSHFDIAPTLMHDVLGYTNPSSDYALGQSLFVSTTRTPLIVGSYLHVGIRSNQTITEILPTGEYLLYDLKYNELPSSEVKTTDLNFAFNLMQRFYQ